MTDSAPTILPSPQGLWQASQAINALTSLAMGIRARREREGRLRHAEDEHAALQHEIRQHPPVRLMSEDEQQAWRQHVPAGLATQHDGEPVSVWTAGLADAQGDPTGEWGVEAHGWDGNGAPAASAFVVCRTAEDALTMAQYLREDATPDTVRHVHDLATVGSGHYAAPPQDATTFGEALVLSEHDWETALRRELPPALADQIIVKDPTHRHHAAWRELHELANAEVLRVGADPAKLAVLVRQRPRWRDGSFNPPSLAYWAITQSRTDPKYPRIVTGAHAEDTPDAVEAPAGTAGTAPAGTRIRLAEVRSPQDAVAWAQGLDSGDRGHQLEAATGFGHWGDQVDGHLSRKFPGLARKAVATATGEHRAAPEPDPATADMLAERIGELDPDKPIHRREALTMLGHVPTGIDRLIAEKFPDDPKIAEKVQELYPDGFEEPNAAVWRNRAAGEESAAAADAARPDDESTPERENLDGQSAAQGERGLAAAQRGIANKVAGTQPEVLRRTVQKQGTGPARRT